MPRIKGRPKVSELRQLDLAEKMFVATFGEDADPCLVRLVEQLNVTAYLAARPGSISSSRRLIRERWKCLKAFEKIVQSKNAGETFKRIGAIQECWSRPRDPKFLEVLAWLRREKDAPVYWGQLENKDGTPLKITIRFLVKKLNKLNPDGKSSTTSTHVRRYLWYAGDPRGSPN